MPTGERACAESSTESFRNSSICRRQPHAQRAISPTLNSRIWAKSALIGPINALFAHIREFKVGDIARCACGCRRHMLLFLKVHVEDSAHARWPIGNRDGENL